jgi:xyloglucan:xyloglucosyl transferase
VCSAGEGGWWDGAAYQELNANQIGQLHSVRKNYLVYDYCTDGERSGKAPVECASNWYE